MNQSITIKHFLQKNSVHASNIKYIIREDNRTNIYLLDNRVVSCFHTIKALKEVLPEEHFCLIKKGILVAKNQIVSIDRNMYSMLDGRVFDGRKRGLKEHQQLNDSLNRNINLPIAGINDIASAFRILDDMPAAFCVIQLLFDDLGKGIDFIFRYCNKAMEQLENKTLDEMVDRSFYDIFPNADKKWLISYANVALNGTTCTITDYSPEVDKTLTIHCFQPMEGFCACLLLEN
ncbi:MAG: LytTR family transcriptional regulator DNA-binding domain-containing protein [Lachnospiraceae bacterium]|nr:LytTR family transcriptional regulator DNA-binding domain-containing protein [Lachnospiraceae bacterium]